MIFPFLHAKAFIEIKLTKKRLPGIAPEAFKAVVYSERNTHYLECTKFTTADWAEITTWHYLPKICNLATQVFMESILRLYYSTFWKKNIFFCVFCTQRGRKRTPETYQGQGRPFSWNRFSTISNDFLEIEPVGSLRMPRISKVSRLRSSTTLNFFG